MGHSRLGDGAQEVGVGHSRLEGGTQKIRGQRILVPVGQWARVLRDSRAV